jgi:hypothetical protein
MEQTSIISSESCNYSRISPPLMKHKVSLLCSEMPDTEPCPQKEASTGMNLILGIVHCITLKSPQCFRGWTCLHLQVEDENQKTKSDGPVKDRVSIYGIPLSNGPTGVGSPLSSYT